MRSAVAEQRFLIGSGGVVNLLVQLSFDLVEGERLGLVEILVQIGWILKNGKPLRGICHACLG